MKLLTSLLLVFFCVLKLNAQINEAEPAAGGCIAPEVTVSASSTVICNGDQVTLSATGADSYTWMPGNLSGSTIIVSPSTTTQYIVTGMDLSGCTGTDTIIISVNALPSAEITAQTTIRSTQYASSVISFSSQAGPVDRSASKALGTPDVYPLYGDNINAWASLTPDAQRESLVLEFDSAQYVDFIRIYETYSTGSIDTIYLRDASDGTWNNVFQTTAKSNPAYARVFKIYLDQTPFKADAMRIAINSAAVPGFNEIDAVSITGNAMVFTNDDVSVCEVTDVTLMASAAQSYLWSPGGSTDQSISTIALSSTTYIVEVMDNGCSNVDTFDITVNPAPPVNVITGATTICPGDTVIFTYNGTDEFVWRPADSDTVHFAAPSSSTEEILIVISEEQCFNSRNFHIHVLEEPIVTASASMNLICSGSSTDLMVNGALTYLWSTGETDSVITVMPASDSVFSVVGTNSEGCSDTAFVTVDVEVCTGINEAEYDLSVYPNPATDELYIKSTEYIQSVSLVNLMGQILAEEYVGGSFLKMNIRTLSSGIYFLKLTDQDERVNLYKVLVK